MILLLFPTIFKNQVAFSSIYMVISNDSFSARYKGVKKELVDKAHNINYPPEKCVTLDDWTPVKGYDFSTDFDFDKFISSYFQTGFQATNLAIAIDIIQQMKKDNATVFLGLTSNMISSGLREIIAWLVKEKLVDVLVTTAGGVEEDIIKSIKPFVIGNFNTPGSYLKDQGVNRTGNLFIPNDRYLYFERLFNKFLDKVYDKQKRTGKIINSTDFVYELGKEIKDENSVVYWATKNKIPLICLPITDGSMGDLIYFFKQKNPDFQLDIADDIVTITNIALNAEKTGLIALGGSVPKHHIANANLFRGGADYAVYITTAHEGEGSNAGANPDEAVSWGKIKPDAKMIKVEGDATIIFPLIIAGAFKSNFKICSEEKKKEE